MKSNLIRQEQYRAGAVIDGNGTFDGMVGMIQLDV